MVRNSTRLKVVKEFENGAFIEYSKDKLAYQLVEQSDNHQFQKTKIFRGKSYSTARIARFDGTRNKFVEFKIIGRSTEKRQMDVVFIGNTTNPILKIFIVAGQHGDEKGSRRVG